MSPLEWLAALCGLGSLLALGGSALQWLRQSQHLAQQKRVLAFASELAYAREAQERLDELQDNVATTLDHSTKSARAVHKAIADIPFDILEQIPATREGARQIRKVHDLASDGIYAGLGLYSRWRLGREKARNHSPQDDGSSD